MHYTIVMRRYTLGIESLSLGSELTHPSRGRQTMDACCHLQISCHVLIAQLSYGGSCVPLQLTGTLIVPPHEPPLLSLT